MRGDERGHRGAAVLWRGAGLLAGAMLAGLVFHGRVLAAELGDVVMDRHSTANGVGAVVFPHWKHRIRFKCYACHPAVFEMKGGANEISMDGLRAGEACAKCHNGKIAFAVGFETCRSCHSLPPP